MGAAVDVDDEAIEDAPCLLRARSLVLVAVLGLLSRQVAAGAAAVVTVMVVVVVTLVAVVAGMTALANPLLSLFPDASASPFSPSCPGLRSRSTTLTADRCVSGTTAPGPTASLDTASARVTGDELSVELGRSVVAPARRPSGLRPAGGRPPPSSRGRRAGRTGARPP